MLGTFNTEVKPWSLCLFNRIFLKHSFYVDLNIYICRNIEEFSYESESTTPNVFLCEWILDRQLWTGISRTNQWKQPSLHWVSSLFIEGNCHQSDFNLFSMALWVRTKQCPFQFFLLPSNTLFHCFHEAQNINRGYIKSLKKGRSLIARKWPSHFQLHIQRCPTISKWELRFSISETTEWIQKCFYHQIYFNIW